MIILVCVLLIMGGVLSQSCTQRSQNKDLKKESAEVVVQRVCGKCHSLKIGDKYIAKAGDDKPVIELLSGKSRADWESTVLRMKNEHNCDINKGEEDLIVDYLAEKFGESTTSNVLPSEDSELVQIACGTCHGIVIVDANNPQNIITRITKSPLGGDIRLPAGKDDWRETVTRMVVRNHCSIPGGVGGDVFNRIVNWLNNNVNSYVGQHLDPNISGGQELTQVYCGICHGIVINGVRVTRGNRYWDVNVPLNKDVNGWRITVERMVYRNSCPLPGGSVAIDKVASYLAGINVPPPNISSMTGEELTQMFCNQCHGLVVGNTRITYNALAVDVVLLDGKTQGARNDWRFTVARMVEMNGCFIPGGVNDCAVDPSTPFCKIVAYLENNFGPGCCGDVGAWSDEKLVRSACGSCHGIRGYSKVVTVSPGIYAWLFDGKSAGDWELTVNRMINVNGATVPAGVLNRIVTWLTNEAGPGCCGSIPLTEPQLIAQAACGTCHGMVIGVGNNNKRLTTGMTLYLGNVYGWDAFPLGKDIIHWTKTVNRMLLRRLATRGTNPSLEQRQALINWLVQEAGPSVYGDPETQGLRSARDLYMTYCHKCHGPEAEGMQIRSDYQWITMYQLAKTILNPGDVVNAWGLWHRGPDHPNWPPSTATTFMPNYLWNVYSQGFPDRRLSPSEWNVLDSYLMAFADTYDCVNCHRWHDISYDYLPPEGDSDGDNVIDFPLDQTPPSPPTILNISASAGSITLSWSENTERDFMGYLIMYASINNCSQDCASCTSWTPSNVVVSSMDGESYHMPVYDTTYTIDGLASGTYCLKVVSVDFTCWSPRPVSLGLPCNNSETTAGPVTVQ